MLDVDRFEKMLCAGLIVRNAWRGTAPDGREMLCALSALSREVEESKNPRAADMPLWLARLIPWLDDAPSASAWPDIMRRLARVARALPGADAEALHRADYACRTVAVRFACDNAGAYAAERAAVLGAEGGASWAAMSATWHSTVAADDIARGMLDVIERAVGLA